ncbi:MULTISPECIES: winged helix-turn-helix domain-containing protein [Cellulomonas]|uniref:Helix-turn-helix transcriptional regulator n=1 Tax=Cellulomonas denverensis TaxID=264297 RepID=A0A7X6R0H7_9CELL|nr:winged helix-turn-helix domain-containing protein [Cellulomonas denverensis]NKY24324.1 helix-turn-helix transcriptional regulator [Cellulomonas denverensis]QZN87806.1 winged helix-turn-helix domain-containing protein [Cellulomonas sp. C5510]GIG27298.1 hypothetical protein Cde04nite_35420 [Cellulomonas denverensis]
MPRIVVPRPQPHYVSRAIEVLGSHTRVELLHQLMRNAPLSSDALAQALELGVRHVNEHLRELRAFGLVVAEPVPGPHGHLRAGWTVDRHRLEYVAAVCSEYLLGS